MKICLILAIALCMPVLSCRAQKAHLAVGDTMPSFTLADQDGKPFSSADYAGRKAMVIYFYPKDESPACTKEACTFRDSYADFEKAGAIVIGINPAPAETHKRFATNHRLPFILLSDPGNKVLRRFGVKGKIIVTGRETFVVSKEGRIVYTFNSFTNGAKDATETLRFLQGGLQ